MPNNHDRKEYSKMYAKGIKDSEKDGIVDRMMHDIGDMLSSPHTTGGKGYEDGYHGKDFSPPASDSKGGCFITTACVRAKGLPDNCLELETLRAFRDGYIARQPDGKALIKEYYCIAPGIVAAIEARSAQSGNVFTDIYRDDIRTVLRLIDHGKDEAALRHYHGMVRRFERIVAS